MIPIAIGAVAGAIAAPVIDLLLDLFKKISDWLHNLNRPK